MTLADMRAALDTLDRLANQALGAHHRNFAHNLTLVFAHIEATPFLSAIKEEATKELEFLDWYTTAKQNRPPGMVGNGRLDWPTDVDGYLGMRLLLLEHIAKGKETVDDYCRYFLATGPGYQTKQNEFCDALTEPALREFIGRAAGVVNTEANKPPSLGQRFMGFLHSLWASFVTALSNAIVQLGVGFAVGYATRLLTE